MRAFHKGELSSDITEKIFVSIYFILLKTMPNSSEAFGQYNLKRVANKYLYLIN
jgi:hypothetical protein